MERERKRKVEEQRARSQPESRTETTGTPAVKQPSLAYLVTLFDGERYEVIPYAPLDSTEERQRVLTAVKEAESKTPVPEDKSEEVQLQRGQDRD
mgnify:CR=1 FL=1